MAYKLTEGSLEMIMAGGQLDKPVMQILGNKKIKGSGANERYRLLVSDGKHCLSFAMLATQLNDKLISGELSDFSVVRVDRYITSLLNNSGQGEKRVMIILDVTVLAPGTEVGGKIGSPVTWSESTSSPAATPAPLQPAPAAPSVPSPRPPPKNKPGPGPSLDSSVLSTQMTHPISSLSPYQNKWVIKARVMKKTPIKTWSNQRGEGKLFSMDLCDESGEIRATAFKDECDKFFEMIQQDKVYYISRATLKTANKQFTSIKNDYEMSFNSDTAVAECMEECDVPEVKFDYVSISDIASKNPDTMIDVIGVCKSASELGEVTTRKTGALLKKRDVMLVDSTGGVSLTLWGADAAAFDGSSNPVVAIKGARVSEFQGSKQLSSMASSLLRLNPDVPEAHKLRGWYDNGGSDMDIVNISARTGTMGGGTGEWITFAQAEALQLGSGEKGDYYSLLGVLTFTFSDNAVYKACPQEQCNKKLVDQENGLFRCEKCNRDYPNFKYRILLAATVSDPTGDQRITAFSEAAEAMLGETSAEVGRRFDYDKKGYAELFDNVKFKTFVFKFRTKMETYSDEARLKTTVMNAAPVDYKDASARLIKSITATTGIKL